MKKSIILLSLLVCGSLVAGSLIAAPASDFIIGNKITLNQPVTDSISYNSAILGFPPGLADFDPMDFSPFPVGSSSTYAPCADPVSNQGFAFNLKTPHSRKNNTNIKIFLHWSPTTTDSGNVVWVIKCNGFADIDEVFNNPVTLSVTDASDTVLNKHQIVEIGEISGASTTLGALSVCVFYRDAENAADTYAADACALEISPKILTDTPGGSLLPSSK